MCLAVGTLWMSGRRARTLSRRVRSTTVRRPSCKRKPANARHGPADGCCGRVRAYQNVPSMPFKNEAMAASIGKTVEEMNTSPTYEIRLQCGLRCAGAEQVSLIPPDVVMSRRAGVVGSDGSVDFNALSYGINGARPMILSCSSSARDRLLASSSA